MDGPNHSPGSLSYLMPHCTMWWMAYKCGGPGRSMNHRKMVTYSAHACNDATSAPRRHSGPSKCRCSAVAISIWDTLSMQPHPASLVIAYGANTGKSRRYVNRNSERTCRLYFVLLPPAFSLYTWPNSTVATAAII